jgi:hypothetical protein
MDTSILDIPDDDSGICIFQQKGGIPPDLAQPPTMYAILG